MDKVDHKPSKQERQAHQARQKVLDKYLSPEKESKAQFADPAMLFG
jgi:hypothetical protein